MKYTLPLTVAVLLAAVHVQPARAQVSLLTNADVVRFVTTMQMPDPAVITLVSEATAANATRFDISPLGVSDLLAHGVSPAIIAAMRQSPPPAAAMPVQRASSTPPIPLNESQAVQATIDLPKGLLPTAVPRGYTGMDCVKIAAALKFLPLTKSQFETSTAYNQRIAVIAESSSLYGSVKMSDTLAFRIEGVIEPRYEADKGVLSVRFNFKGVGGSYPAAYWPGEPILQMLYEPLMVTQGATSTYVGTTGFGVKASVRRVTEEVCGLLRRGGEGWMDTEERTQHRAGLPGGTVEFQMSVTDAQSFIKKPGVLLIGKLKSPFYLAGGRDSHEPTRDTPIDRQAIVDGPVLGLAEVWYYDINTGRVFYRQHVRR